MDENGQLTQEVPDTSNSAAAMMIGKNLIGIYLKDSIVSAITIKPILDESSDIADPKFTLEDMVKLYGDPSNILKGGASSDLKCQNLFILYPERGLIFIAESKDFVTQNGVFPSRIRILPELAVQEVLFFNPSEIKGSPISSDIGSIHCEIEDEIPNWQGFTTFDFSRVSSYCQ